MNCNTTHYRANSSSVPGDPTLGATSATYTLTASAADDGKLYHAVFNNACGFALSSDAGLTVNALPDCAITGPDQLCTNSTGNVYSAPAGLGIFRWSISGSGSISGATNTQSVSVNAGGSNTLTLTLTVTNANGCSSTCTKVVTNVPKPRATVSGGGTICVGGSANLQAALTGFGPWTVTWSDGVTQTNVAASPATRSVSPVATTLYSVTSVSDTNCANTGTGSATVTVNTPPAVTLNPTNRTVCTGGSVSLISTATGNPTPGVQWQASGDGGNSFTNLVGATNTTYTFTATLADDGKVYHAIFTNVCGTAASDGATLAVNALPACGITGADRICTNSAGNIYVGPDSLSGYRWTISGNGTINGATNAQSANVTAGATATFTLTLTVTNASGCTSSCSKIVTNVARPTATVSGGGTICSGNSVNIQAALTGTGPWNVQWSDGAVQFGVTNGPATRSVSPSSTTVYTVTSLESGDCFNSGTGSATVTVNAAPQVTLNPVDTTVCVSNSVTFTATASGTPTPAVQWQVSTNGGLSFSNITSQTSTGYTFTATANDGGRQYRARFTNSCGTLFSTAATLTVNPAPTATVSGTAAICPGDSANIQAALTGTAPWTVVWSDGLTNVGVGSSPLTRSVNPSSTTTYTVTSVADANCANSGTGSATITVNTAPSVTLNPTNQTVCVGGSLSFSSTASGSPAPTVQWQASGDGGNSFTNILGATGATYTFAASAADGGKQYHAVFNNLCGSATSSNATLTANGLPVCGITGPDQVCSNSAGNIYLAPAGLAGYRWSISGNGSFSGTTNAQSASVTAGSSGTFTLTLTTTNATGCTSTCSKIVTIVPKPTASVSGGGAICPGNSTNVQAALSGTGPWLVVWSDGVTQTNVAVSPVVRSVSPVSTTVYTVTSVSDANCSNAGSGSATVTVNVLPVVTLDPTNRAVCAGSPVSFTATASGSPAPGVQWQASGDGGNSFTNILGATNATLTFTTSAGDEGKIYHAGFANLCGAAMSANATLTFSAAPGCSITGPDRTCTNTPNLYFAPLSLSSYGWAVSGNGTISGATNAQTVNITAGLSGTFTLTLTLTNANGCASSCAKTVTNVPKPSASVSGSGAICPGGTNTIQATLTGTGPWTVAWSDGVTQTNVAASPAVRGVSPLVTTAYSVTSVTDANCANAGAGSATVTVNSPPALTLNPTNQSVCSGTVVSFSAAASGSPSPAVQWQVSTNGGLNFVNLGGATNSTYSFTSAVTDHTNRYRARFTNACGTVLSTAAMLAVYPTPSAVINADPTVCANSTGNSASVADAGSGASYAWTISGGSLTAGAGTPNITYSSGGGTVQLGVTVSNVFGCQAAGNKTVAVVFSSPTPLTEAWATLPTPRWDSSTLGTGDHAYAEGNSIPFRFQLTGLCARSPFCIVIRYDFKDGNTARHFTDFLTTYNSSESTVSGHGCDNETCASGPNLYPIPADTNLSYQFPGNFTVYNGTITNVSGYTYVPGSFDEKELTLTGVVADGSGTKDVLILFGGHLARENEWGLNNGASHFPGSAAKMLLKFCSESSFNNLGINPGGIIPQADVGITKSVNFSQLCAGNNLTYTLRLTNEGPNQATGVTVLDSLPPGTTLVSATPSQGSFSGTTNLNFALGAINAGSNATITIVAAISSNAPAGVITNTATVSVTSPADPNLLNNTASATTLVFARTTVSPLGAQQSCLNYPFRFTATATGTGPLTYQWTRNGTNIAGATDSSYNIGSVQVSDTGPYCVIVAGFCNVVTNCGSLAISTNSATSPLADQTRCPGENATFSTTPVGPGPFTVVWRKNGAVIPGATATSLTLTNVSAASAAVYCVEVLGTCNVSNNCATLTVLTNASVAALTNLAQCVGSTATFTALASGSGPFSYAWFKGTNALAGATNSSLVLSNLTGTDAGNYCVVATGACGSATNCATLTVNAPTTLDPLVSLTNCPGASVSFTAVANGSGPFTYQWLQAGAPLAGQTNSALALTNIAEGDAGTYAAVVAGACNSVTNLATLTVLTNVSATQPADLVLCENSPATFSTVAGGSGPFTYQWTKGGAPLAGATASAFSIASITPSDAGVYCVQVTGACGSVTNCAALTLLPGTAATPVGNQTLCPGGTAAFATLASGSGPFTYQWTRAGAPVAGATRSSLTLTNVAAADAGQYCVQVSGACGSVTNCALLNVLTNTAATPLGDLVLCPGGTAAFSTLASGIGPFSYQWTKAGTPLGGATGSSLTLTNVTAADAATYCVQVSGACGSVTNCATLTISTNTTATPPGSLTLCPGGTATFSTVAGGSGPFTYQWTKAGSPLGGATGSSLTLSNVAAADAAQYCVRVTGACGSVTNCATLTVLSNTTATALSNLALCAGSTATFSTVAGGTGPFGYQWTKAGAPLAGATDSSLTLANITAADATQYCVQVTGACGSVTNCATLALLTNVTATPLSDLTRCPGGNASFSTVAGGTGPFTYQWSQGGAPLAGATDSSLTLTNLTAADAGQYCVLVSSLCGSASQCATLTVLTNTSATSLTSLTNCPGTSATFSTIASGTGPFSYQWTRAGAALGGATNSALTLTNITSADAAPYCVQVTGACGSVTNCATLTVLTNTTATTPSNLTLCPGSTATFSTTAGGTGPFTYQWTKAGSPLGGATGSSLTLTNITSADAAQYCVQVTGACGSVTNCATLTVLTNATATTPGSLTLCPGSTAAFNTTAAGTGPFTYQWTKAGSPLGGATGSSLTLTNITSADAAQYCVQVTGACGSVTNCATLTVLTNTSATTPGNLTLCPGNTATFSATAGGTGPFTYQWTKAGSPLGGATSSSLTLTNITAADAAQYCVQVTGACGSVTNCATLTVLTNITATTPANLTLCSGNTAAFSTLASGTGPFSYQWTKAGSPIGGATNSSLTLTNIAPGDAGQYCVRVTGFCSSVTNCATLTVATNTTATPLASLTLCQGSPANFSTVAGGAGPFTYQWTRNGTNLSGAVGSSYSIASVTAGDAGAYCVKVSGACGSVTNCASLTVLLPRVTVTKACPPVPVAPGGMLVFSGTISNSGTVTLTNVVVVNNRPANNTPVFGPVTLAAGQVTNFSGSYAVAADFCGPAVDTLTARANALCTGNLVTDTASAACPVLATPALGLAGACPPAAVARGDTLFYHGSVSNAGNATLTNVVVFSSLPTNNTPVFVTPGLAPGEALEFDGSFVVPVGQCAATVTYTLTASGKSVCNGTNVTKSVAQTCPVTVAPRLVVTQNCPPSPVPPGGVLTFSGTVSNAGNLTLTNVLVVNDQPSNNTPVLGPVTLAPNQTTNFSGSYRVYAQACPPYVNTLTATGAQICNGSNVTATVTKYCPGSSTPQLGLRVDCPSPPPLLGQVVFYSGSVSNAGDVPLNNVLVTDNHSGFVTQVDALAAGETADFFSFYLATNCGPSVVTLVTVVGADACTGAIVNQQASVGCPITCATVQRPVLVNVRAGGGQFQFTWDTVSGYSYAVQRSDAVSPTNWQVVTNYPGTGGPVTFTAPPSSPKQFYRVQVQ